MTLPSDDPRLVDVVAYVTDEGHSKHHWRALDASLGVNPVSDWNRPALLVVCRDAAERDYVRKQVEVALTPASAELSDAQENYRNYLLILRRDVKAILADALRAAPMTATTRATLAEIVDALGEAPTP
jgi:hypothetical protein